MIRHLRVGLLRILGNEDTAVEDRSPASGQDTFEAFDAGTAGHGMIDIEVVVDQLLIAAQVEPLEVAVCALAEEPGADVGPRPSSAKTEIETLVAAAGGLLQIDAGEMERG